MKKILTWVLLLAMVVGLFAGCKQQEEPPVVEAPSVSQAMEYVKALYPNEKEAQITAVDYERMGVVRINNVPFDVVWTTDVSEDLVKIVANNDGIVTIDINEECQEDTPYTLTATITDAKGEKATHSWNYIVPKAADMGQIVDAAYALQSGESLPYESTLTGEVLSVKTPYDPSYKNVTVVIEVAARPGKTIECYRMKGEGVEDIAIGDTITVTGILKNYNGTIEFDAGCICTKIVAGERVEAPEDPKQIVDEAYALGANKSLPYEATLTGVITQVKDAYDSGYNNISVIIAIEGRESKPILCYRMKGENIDKIGVNDIITVTGYITNYVGSSGHSTIEYTAGCQMIAWEDKAGPVVPDTMQEIVDQAYALGANQTLKYEATLTGKITKVKTAYDAGYDNVSVEFVVEGRENKPILAYRMKGNGASVIDIGDTITVKGYITNYVGDAGYSTIEYTAGCQLLSYKKNSNVAPSDPVKIVEAAYALGANEQLPYKVTLTGVITRVKTAYDPGYNNVTVIIEVPGTTDMPITCYRMKGSGADKIAVGDTITVTGYIVNYQHSSGDTEVEFTAGCSLDKWTVGSEKPEEPEKPDVPVTGNATMVTEPVADTAYKFGMNQVTAGAIYYFNGTLAGDYLGTTADPSEAVDIYLEINPNAVGSAYLYFMNDDVKTYITMEEFIKSGKTYYSAKPVFTTEVPAISYTWNEVLNTVVTNTGNDIFCFGTYGTFTTIGCTSDYYYEQDGVVDVSQFIGRFYTVEITEEPDVPEVPDDYSGQAAIMEQIKALEVGATIEDVTLTGEIVKINTEYSEQFQNITVTIAVFGTEDTLKCYRIKGDAASILAVGDTITVNGTVKNYQHSSGDTELEFDAGSMIIEHIPAGSEPEAPDYSEQAAIMEQIKALEVGATIEDVTLTGEIVKINTEYSEQFQNITVTIAVFGTEDTLKCYRIKGDAASILAVGDIITVNGTVKNYQHSSGDTELEFDAGSMIIEHIPAGSEPEVPEDPEEPEEPTKAPVVVTEPYTETPYFLGMYQGDASLKKNFYFNGKLSGNYLGMTEDLAEAVNVYLELSEDVEGAAYLYFMDGEVKTYITMEEYKDGNYYKAKAILTTEVPSVYYTWSEDLGTIVCTTENDTYCFGTYSNYTTLSCTRSYFVTGDNAANVDVTQFIGRLYELEAEVMSDREILELAYALQPGETTEETYVLAGYVTKIKDAWNSQFSNISVIFEVPGCEDLPMLAYRLAGEGAETLAVGDLIIVSGQFTNYNGTIEYAQGCELLGKVSASQIVDLIYEYDFATNGDMEGVRLTGVVTSIDYAYSEEYGNISVTIVVDGKDDKPIACFRVVGEGIADIAVGDTISVLGTVTYYEAKDSYQFIAGSQVLSIVPGEGSGDGEENQGVTIDLTNKENRTEYSSSVQVWEQNGIKITNEKAASTSNVGDYAPIRLYQSTSVKVEYPGMTKLVFTCNDYKNTYASSLQSSIGSQGEVTVDGVVVTVVLAEAADEFVIAKLAAQVRLDSLTVYTGAEADTPEEPEEPVDPDAPVALKAGDKVVIYCPAYNKALSSTKTGYYNVGVDITVTEGVVAGYSDAEIWTVGVNPDGTYTFSQNGQNIGLAESFSSMNLGAENDDWQVVDLGDGLFTVQNVGRGNYLEWYDAMNNWSTYNTSSAATNKLCQMSFYIVEAAQ